MPIDRPTTLRNAERLLRQGRLDQAIAEYLRAVEEQPRDWNTANLLGDLYVRAGQIDKAVNQFVRIADTLTADGFASRASAIYKKALKLQPGHEEALLKAARIATDQGLMADARRYLVAVAEQRGRRGDTHGAAEIHRTLEGLDKARRRESPGPPVETIASAPVPSAAAEAIPAVSHMPDSKPVSTPVGHEPPALPAPTVEPTGETEGLEVDLSLELDELTKIVTVSSAPGQGSPTSLDPVFAEMRDQAGRRLALDPLEVEYQRGVALHAAGHLDACIPPLLEATKAPGLRFSAASLLGRICCERGRMAEAIDWFERAVEAPAPTASDEYLLLYELGTTLEASGDVARALATYQQLQARVGEFRDITARIDRLRQGSGTRVSS